MTILYARYLIQFFFLSVFQEILLQLLHIQNYDVLCQKSDLYPELLISFYVSVHYVLFGISLPIIWPVLFLQQDKK